VGWRLVSGSYQKVFDSKPTVWDGDLYLKLLMWDGDFSNLQFRSKPTVWDGDVINKFSSSKPCGMRVSLF
jgi:hypothetical protein